MTSTARFSPGDFSMTSIVVQKFVLSVLGYLLVFYLLSFPIFAIVRAVTGISIKRLGYFSLRHISVSVKPGIRLFIGKLGLSFHTPTVARPGWTSISISNFEIVIDPKVVLHPEYDLFSKDEGKKKGRGKGREKDEDVGPTESKEVNGEGVGSGTDGTENETEKEVDDPTWSIIPPKTVTFYIVRFLLNYAKFCSLYVNSTTITYTDLTSLVIGNLLIKADLRSSSRAKSNFIGTLDNTPLKANELPAHFRILIDEFYIANLLHREEPQEVLESLMVDINGILGKNDLSLKELSFGFKFGKSVIMVDRVSRVLEEIKNIRQRAASDMLKKRRASSSVSLKSNASVESDFSSTTCNSFDTSTTTTGNPNISPSPSPPLIDKDKIASQGILSDADVRNLTKMGTKLIRVVKEVEFRATYIGVFGISSTTTDDNTKIGLAATARDFTLDLRRLNPDSPGFKLLFSPGDSAHQAVMTIGSITCGVDFGTSQEEFLYAPLATIVSKTNIFSRTLRIVQDIDSQYNENILRATINLSNPNINLGTEHLPVLLKALGGGSNNSLKTNNTMMQFKETRTSFHKLYPRALIKFTIDEPAARIVLDSNTTTDNESMVISSASKVYCDFESSHSKDVDNPNYSVNASLQISSFDTWYRSSEGERNDLMLSESIYFKVVANTLPYLSIVSTAKLSNAHILLTKYEIFDNLRQIAIHFKKNKSAAPEAITTKKKSSSNFLTQLPPWCTRIKFEIADTAVSIASEKVRRDSETCRGLTLKMANSIIEYRGPTPNTHHPNYPPYSYSTDGIYHNNSASSSSATLLPDKRRLSIVMDGIEGYKIIEPFGMEQTPENRFLSIPTLAIALSSTNNNQRNSCQYLPDSAPAPLPPQLQCNIVMRQAVISYDINLHFLGLVLADLLSHVTALDVGRDIKKPQRTPKNKSQSLDHLSIHFRSENSRLKIKLVNDVKTMLEFNGLELFLKPSSNPVLTSKSIRLYAIHPTVPNAWGIVVSIRGADILYDLKAKDEIDDKVVVNFEAIRMNMPYQFIYYHIFDNAISLTKSIQNLHQQFKTKDYYLVIKPKERSEIPNIPRVRIKTPAFIISLEDDHFESELGMIFQLGLLEQKSRLVKEAAFEEKMTVVCNADEYRNKPKEKEKEKEKEKDEKVNNNNNNSTETIEEESEIEPPTGTNTGTNTPKHTAANPVKVKKHHTHLGVNRAASHNTALKSLQNAFHIRPNARSRKLSYTMTQSTTPSTDSCVSFEMARRRLHENFSTSWIHLYKEARRTRDASIKKNIEQIWGADETPRDTATSERIVGYSDDPLLFLTYFKSMDLIISKPKFDRPGLSQYLHDIGKGLPLDSRFSLLIPLYLDLKLGELSMELRDYPLPLVHFPELQANQNPNTASVQLSGHFIVAEELSTHPSNIRRIMVPLIPSSSIVLEDEESQRYVIEVNRTVASVKMYTDMNFVINSFNPTRITWGQSIQPALQTVMMGFDSFSKPPIDPSPKLGFWDKIRAVFHARIDLKWNGGDVYLLLKGSRSPYDLLKTGSGFVFAWRNNVNFTINGKDDPKRLMVTDSQEFVWAVPSYVHWEREYLRQFKTFNRATRSKTNFNEMNNFQKVILKLSGKVQWKLGLLFEQDSCNPKRAPNEPIERTSEFKPHYDVKLSLPSFVQDFNTYDAYRGFRSQYLHLAISVLSTACGKPDVNCYNTAHLSPFTFRHFKAWWALFDGSLSLPIRSGKLFQPTTLSKPKFGRHVHSVQYKLDFTPVYISHTYRHPNSDDLDKCTRDASTGLKAKVDSFTMDLHQRREPFPSSELKSGQRWRMKMNLAELDFKGTDLRVVCAEFKEKSPEELLAEKENKHLNYSPGSSINDSNSFSHAGSSTVPSSGEFHISDNDYSWIDLDDYSELGEMIPINSTPKVVVLPLMYSPRWTYFRQTDHSDKKIGITSDGKAYYKFGNALAHDCLIGKKHPEITQARLLKGRMDEINEQLKNDDATLDSLQRDLERFPNEEKIIDRITKITASVDNLIKRRDTIKTVLEGYDLLDDDKLEAMECESMHSTMTDKSFDGLAEIADVNSTSSFSNRFIIHNLQFIWNNHNRDAMYRYIHRFELRRQLLYYITRRAVKYVEELVENQQGKGNNDFSIRKEDVDRILKDVLCPDSGVDGAANDKKHEKMKTSTSQERIDSFDDDLRETSSKDFATLDTYLVRFISPQIQLVSDQNPDQCLLVASRNIELKIITVEDTTADDDDEMARTVESRYGCMLHDAHFFVLDKMQVLKKSVLLFSNANYGSKDNSLWPPWLAIECCYDSIPLQDALVVERTTAAIRYDKPNSMYVRRSSSTPSSAISESTDDQQANIETSFCSKYVRSEKNRANRISVDFPRVVARCDSDQYFAVYTIVVDLLVYSEPVAKETTERLERLMLTTDFRDMSKAVERLTLLQRDIYQLLELREEFNIRHDELDENGIYDLLIVEVELRKVFMELIVIMQAIKSGFQKHNKNDASQFLKWAVASDQIIWHALNEDREPFLDIGLADASFNRIESSDGFNSNTVEVGMMQGFHLSQNSIYPEVFSPYENVKDGAVQDKNEKLISVKWTMLDPIGGIPIMESFVVKLQPLKLQVENQTGRQIFAYIFPSNRDTESPFLLAPKIKPASGTSSLIKRSASSYSSSTNHSTTALTDYDTDASTSEIDLQSKSHRMYLTKDHESVRSMNTAVSGSTASSVAANGNGVRNKPSLASSISTSATATTRQQLFKHDNSSNTDQSIESGHTGAVKRKKDNKKEVELNDVSTMIKRASNYMSIVDIQIYSTMLCVSYKVSGEINDNGMVLTF